MKIFVWNKFSTSHKVFIDITFQMLRISLSSPTFLCSWFFLSLTGKWKTKWKEKNQKKKKGTQRFLEGFSVSIWVQLSCWNGWPFTVFHCFVYSFPLWDLIRILNRVWQLVGVPVEFVATLSLCNFSMRASARFWRFWTTTEEKWNHDRNKILDYFNEQMRKGP